MTSGWLDEDAWTSVQAQLPIACVDIAPLRRDAAGRLMIGLILRSSPQQGRRWCLIGGRVRRGEWLQQAVEREWHSAFGDSAALGQHALAQPLVIEYAPDDLPGRPHDPRKHAISLTYPVWTTTTPVVTGPEALEFRWFDPAQLSAQLMGFGQEFVAARVVEAVQRAPVPD